MALPSLKLVFITIILSSSGSLHFGYQIIVLNPTVLIFKDFLNSSFQSHYGYYLSATDYTVLWSVILNMITVGCIIGTLLSLKLLPLFGRKFNFFVSISISSVGCTLCALSYYTNAWELLALGRLIAGTAMGISLCLQPLYFTEISPDDCRGFVNTLTSCLAEFGFALGSVIALPNLLGSDQLWPWLFWLELLPNFIATIITLKLPESPKVLFSKGELRATENSLKFFGHCNTADDIKNIQTELELEKNLLGVQDLFKKRYLRKSMLILTIIQITVQFSGDGATSYFSTLLFETAGLQQNVALYCTVIVALQSLFGTIIAAMITDKYGRKSLLLISLSVMIVINAIFVIILSFSARWVGYISIFAAVVMNLTFGLGPSSVQFSITAEMVPFNCKSAAQSFTLLIGWMVFIFATLIFLPLANIIHQFVFLTFILILVPSVVYLYFNLPETKGKTITEIVEALGYICEDG